ncbi:MAG: serine--tRNA ligase [Dehalococcoidales bacterium]|nr:MAG: serine--tRNA ligase [Dehalococcoidales bacterium]
MLDIRIIRDNPDIVRQALTNRQEDSVILDEILELDTERRQKVTELEDLRHARKELARDRQADSSERGRDLRNMIKDLEDEVKNIETSLEDALLQLPNIPHPSTPVGKDENDNVIVSTWGEQKTFDFTPAPHWTLGESLGIIDFERGVKLSGSRFYVLKGMGARLQRALIAFMLDLHTSRHGYQEIYPPYMVKRECMVGAGQLPKLDENIYRDVEDDLWFVGTAEIPLTNLHRDEIILPGMLPFYYVAYTACFRREKMSAGRDTRGIKRGHQFDKVEMYKFTEPETSYEELEKMVADAEEVCQQLGLPYRVTEHCTADIGFTAAKSYDIDMWAPGCEEWLEVSSCSNCTDFQARRTNIRYRPASDSKPQFVHTLNGSGLALPRLMIAVMENYQQADGSIVVPEVLRGFVGAEIITSP